MSVTRESVNGKKGIHHSQHLPTVAICHALNIKEGPSYFTKTFQKPALLNAIGRKKVAEYEMDLIASRRYQPGTEEPAKIDCITMPVSELPVSAGLGAFS